jgi:4-amino-4-deoxy-L-arabinose transferase-like glycosyltransferase
VLPPALARCRAGGIILPCGLRRGQYLRSVFDDPRGAGSSWEIVMPKRASLQIRLAAAVALAGLGHCYLLFLPGYLWDALLFYAVAAILLAVAYRRAEVTPEAATAGFGGIQELAASVWRSLAGGPTKMGVEAVAAANGLAALSATLVEPPFGVAVALLLWLVPLAGLAASATRRRGAEVGRVEPELQPRADAVEQAEWEAEPAFEPGRREILLAVAGWLLLAAGLRVVGLRALPTWLGGYDAFARQVTEGLRVDVVATPGAWTLGLAILGVGLLLVVLSRAGVSELRGTTSFSASPSRRAPAQGLLRNWRWLVIGGGTSWGIVVLSAAAHSTNWVVGPLWLLALVLLVAWVWQADRAREVSVLPSRVDRSVWLILPALIPALLVVTYRLADIPASLWGDEGAHWWVAKALAEGLQENPFALGAYDVHPMAVAIYHSIWLRLFGATLWSWRLGSAVAGVLAIIPLFLLVRGVLGSRVSWSAVALLVSMPYSLAYCRIGLYAIQPIMPAVLAVYLLVEGVRRASWTLAFLAGLSCGLASLAYGPGLAAVAISLMLLGVLYLTRRPLRRHVLRLALLVIVGWVCAAGPFFLGTGLLGGKPVASKLAEHYPGNVFYAQMVFPDSGVSDLATVGVGGQELFFDARLYGLLIARGLLRGGLNLVSDWVVQQHYLVGPLAGPAGLFFLVGLGWTLARRRRWEMLLWPVWAGVGLLVLSALNSFPPRTAHLAVVFPALAALGAVGIWLFVELLHRFLPFRWVDAFGVLLTAVLVCFGLYSYFVEMPERYPPGLDSIILWRGMEADPGTSLLYVSDPAHPFGYRMWGMSDYDLGFDIAATIHQVPLEELAETDLAALCGGDCRIFFVPEQGVDVLTQIEAKIGCGSTLEHQDYWGNTIGVECVPGQADSG